MEKQELQKMNHPERFKWIDQQLKEGKKFEELFDVRAKLYQLQVKVTPNLKIDIDLPASEEGIMSSRVNAEVMKQWEAFTSTRKEKSKDLFSMALWQFMTNHS